MKEFERQKHIALIIRALGNRSGGAERIYCELANFLCEDNYKVSCLHFETSAAKPFYDVDGRVEVINLHPRFKKNRGKFTSILNLIRSINKKPESDVDKWNKQNGFLVDQLKDYFKLAKPDLAISFLPPANTPALVAAAETGTKVIATNHNVPEQDYEAVNRWDQNPHDRELRKNVLKHAAALHVLFPVFGEWFDPSLQEKIIAIPNYISPEFDDFPKKTAKEKLILGVGRLTDVKNFGQLARAWATLSNEFKDWKVVIYGNGPQNKQLASEIRKLGIADSFILAGHRSDLIGEYSRASIFCHPALYEGFGLAPAEALHCGVPLVAFADCPGVNQFLRHEENGLAVDRSGGDAALADALRRLMSDRTLLERLAGNSSASVSQFSLSRYKKNWSNFISALLAKDKNGKP